MVCCRFATSGALPTPTLLRNTNEVQQLGSELGAAVGAEVAVAYWCATAGAEVDAIVGPARTWHDAIVGPARTRHEELSSFLEDLLQGVVRHRQLRRAIAPGARHWSHDLVVPSAATYWLAVGEKSCAAQRGQEEHGRLMAHARAALARARS